MMLWKFLILLSLPHYGFSEGLKKGSLLQGEYKVVAMKQLPSGEYAVKWEAVELKKQPTDFLHMKATESHVAVEVGRVLSLSAVVEKAHKDHLEVMQVHIKFKDGRRIWLLSQAGKREPLQGESYLKMHAPRSDYRVL